MSAPSTGPADEEQRVRLACLVLVLLTILVYLPVGWHDFSYYDDHDYVTHNSVVQSGLTWNGVQWAFTAFHSSNWHPLTWLSHMLDCTLFGLNPGPQHLVNVLFHSANAALVLLLWFRLTGAFWSSAFVAALFAWHPLHVESVAWIAERKDVLSTFLGLLSLSFYARHARSGGKQTRDYWLAVIFFALGLTAKPMLVTWPFLFLLLDYWPLGRFGRTSVLASRARQEPRPTTAPRTSHFAVLLSEKWPFFLLAAASCAITLLAQHEKAMASLENCPPSLRLSNAAISYVRYLGLAIWPSNLAFIYPLPKHWPLWQAAGAFAVLAAISLLAWKTRRGKPWLLTGWLWFVGTLVPVIGLVQVGAQAMADRYTYFPLIGISVAVVLGIRELALRFRVSTTALGLGGGLVLAACVGLTVHELQFWQNPEVLLHRTIAVTKNNMVAHQVLGAYLYDEAGQREKALAEFREALRIGDSQFQSMSEKAYGVYAHLVLAGDFEKQGALEDARAQYESVLKVLPGSAEAHNDLANVLDELGRPEEALPHYREAVRLKPDAPEAHNNLGTLLARLGRFDEAMSEYTEASRLNPQDSRPYYLAGKACLRRGQSAEAIAQFREALRRNRDDSYTLTFLARVLAADENAQLRNGTEAMALAQRACELTANQQPFVLEALAMACAEAGKFDDAKQTMRKAIDLAAAAQQTNMVSAMQERLELFQSGKPSRESFTNPPEQTVRSP